MFVVDKCLDRDVDVSFYFLLSLGGLISMSGQPFFPVIFLFFIGGDPVKKDHDILRLGVFNGRFWEDGTASHIDQAFVLLVVLHLFSKNNQIQLTILIHHLIILEYSDTPLPPK